MADRGYGSAGVIAEELGAAPVRPLPTATRSAQRANNRLSARAWIALRLGLDLLLLWLAVGVALLTANSAGEISGETFFVVSLPPVTIALCALGGLYRKAFRVRVVDGLGGVLAATSLAAGSLITAAAFLTPQLEPAALVARAWVLASLYLMAGRVLANWVERRVRATRRTAKPALIVGAGQIGAQVEQRLAREPELGLRPLGYLDADPPPREDVPLRRAPVLGRPDELAQVVKETGAEHVVLGFTRDPDSDLFPLVRECESLGLEVTLVPRMFEFVNVRHGLEHLGGLPLFSHEAVDPKSVQFAIKHTLDRLLAGGLLVLLAPVMLAVGVAVKLSSPGPVVFRQRRIGRDGAEFDILKFRSMWMPEPGDELVAGLPPLPEDTAPGGVEGPDRRTPIGAFLRRTSLDELPQLISVLRGEMSLVGPRPERPEFVELFEREVRRYEDRHRVKSGITGWAQVHGLRGKTSVSERVELDNHYISNWSLSLDVKILLLTAGALVAGDREEA